ncbi:MAG: hypothetical protein H6817_07525 [Phycisphaerales bacterium]|nr:hypothetical protein [Phycisphaerales bacterium]
MPANKNASLPILDRVRIASPCNMSWAEMTGDDRTRYCSACRKHVYNFASMTSKEIEALIIEKEGRLCGRLYRRADGTILTANCPVGLAAVRRKAVKLVAGVAATFFFAIQAFAYFVPASKRVRVRSLEPFATIVSRLSPTPPLTFGPIVGIIEYTPATTKPTSGNK